MHVELVIHLKDGRQLINRCDAPLGSWTRPVGPERIRAKARGLMTEGYDASISAQIDALVMGSANFEVRELLALT